MTRKEGSQGWRHATEPYLLFYITALLLHNPIFQQYVYSRVSEEYHYPYNYDKDEKGGCFTTVSTLNTSNSNSDVLKKVQSISARFETGFVMFNTLPAAVVCLFAGYLCDRFGRKPILLMSITGSFLQAVLILVVMVFKLPIWIMFIAATLNGLGGYLAVLLMSTFAYVADVTPPEKRGVKLAYVEGIVFLGGTFASGGSGHLLHSLSFAWSYAIIVMLFLASLCYVIFVLPESLPPALLRSKGNGNFKQLCSEPMARIYRVITRPRPGKWKIRLLIPASVFINMLTLGLSSTTMLFMLNQPLCMTAIKVGYAVGVKFLFVGLGAAIGLKVLSKCLPDYVLMVFGFVSLAGSLSILAFSTEQWMVYLSGVAAFGAGYPAPLFRSNLSKSVDADEQGSMFSLSTTFEMLFTFIGTLTFNAFYNYANAKVGFGGGVFLLACIVALVPFVLAIVFGVITWLTRTPNTLLVSIEESEEGSIHSPQRELIGSLHNATGYGSNDGSSVQTQ